MAISCLDIQVEKGAAWLQMRAERWSGLPLNTHLSGAGC